MGAMKKLYTAHHAGQATAVEAKARTALQDWIRHSRSAEFHSRAESLRRSAERAREGRENLLLNLVD
jgi:hypothetical protein